MSAGPIHAPYDEPFTEEQFEARRDDAGPWPEPTVDEPSEAEVEYMLFDGVGEATDGCCDVENDSHCQHGYPSWAIYLGLI